MNLSEKQLKALAEFLLSDKVFPEEIDHEIDKNRSELMDWLLGNDGQAALMKALGCKFSDWRLTAICRPEGKSPAWIFRLVDWYRSKDTVDYSGDGATLAEALINAVLDMLGVTE